MDCLEEWKILIEELEQFYDVSIMFIFKLAKEEDLINTLIEFDFDYPVIFDINDEFIKKNKFINHPLFYVFLLNEDNKIIMLGNPIGNNNLWTLYKEQIKMLDSLIIE